MKLVVDIIEAYFSTVAPHTGAWIETQICASRLTDPAVAPHTGAWIET